MDMESNPHGLSRIWYVWEWGWLNYSRYVVHILSRTVFDICCYQVEILLCLKKNLHGFHANLRCGYLMTFGYIWCRGLCNQTDISHALVFQFGHCSSNHSPYMEDLLYTCKTGHVFYHGWAKSQSMRADFTNCILSSVGILHDYDECWLLSLLRVFLSSWPSHSLIHCLNNEGNGTNFPIYIYIFSITRLSMKV